MSPLSRQESGTMTYEFEEGPPGGHLHLVQTDQASRETKPTSLSDCPPRNVPCPCGLRQRVLPTIFFQYAQIAADWRSCHRAGQGAS